MTYLCQTRKGCPKKHVEAGRDGCPMWIGMQETNADGDVRDVSGCFPAVMARLTLQQTRVMSCNTAEVSALRARVAEQAARAVERTILAVEQRIDGHPRIEAAPHNGRAS